MAMIPQFQFQLSKSKTIAILTLGLLLFSTFSISPSTSDTFSVYNGDSDESWSQESASAEDEVKVQIDHKAPVAEGKTLTKVEPESEPQPEPETGTQNAVNISDLTDAQLAELFREIDANPLGHTFQVPKAPPKMDRGFNFKVEPKPKADQDLKINSSEESVESASEEDALDWADANTDEGEGDTGPVFEKFLADNKDLLARDELIGESDEDYVFDSNEDGTLPLSSGFGFADGGDDASSLWPWVYQNQNPEASVQEEQGDILKDGQDNNKDKQAVEDLGLGLDSNLASQQMEVDSQVQDIVDSMQILDAIQKELEGLQGLPVDSENDLSFRNDMKVNDGFPWLRYDDTPVNPDTDNLDEAFGKNFGVFFRSKNSKSDLDSILASNPDDSSGDIALSPADWANIVYMDKLLSLLSIILCFFLIHMAIRCCVHCKRLRDTSSRRNQPQLTIIRVEGNQFRSALSPHLNEDKMALVHSATSSNYSPLPCYYEEKPPTYTEAVTDQGS